jgi:hypothetical protein
VTKLAPRLPRGKAQTAAVAVGRLDRNGFHRDIRGMSEVAGIAVTTTTTPIGGVVGGCAR